ncbi:protein IMPACT-like [Uloborus diversus]|uniref:protein IMPACT-like n=1 Tax=Uloborus diversus TaxID=327109 RepID=UPI002409CEC9|nr:protein IMPACT-like [Uloborus diversus]
MDEISQDRLNANESLRVDEVEALSAIFGDDWLEEDAEHRVYSINVANSTGNSIYLQVTLPENYPLDGPPIYQISAPWMSREGKASLCSEIEDIYCSNAGESIIYLWIEKLKDFAYPMSFLHPQNTAADEVIEEDNDAEPSAALNSTEQEILEIETDELPPIAHGEPITDRKSVFQAHAAKVLTVQQVKQVLDELKQNRKIASATHNIYAYRIAREKGTFLQDCEDDGETKAGSILLHLLQILNVVNVLVVVSRWYGGIHLGPDRFKHINNAARILLCELGLTNDEKTSSGTSKSQKKMKDSPKVKNAS